jgi:hypothetical protein
MDETAESAAEHNTLSGAHARVANKGSLLLPAVISLGIALLGAVCLFVTDNPWMVLGGGVSVVLCALPFALYKREPTPLAPTYLTMLYLFLAYPLKLVAVRMHMPYVFEDYPGLLWDDALVSRALWLLVLGLVGYFVGYYRPPRLFIAPLTRARLPLSGRLDGRWPWRVLLVSAVGWGSLAAQIVTGFWSTFASLGRNWSPGLNQIYAYSGNYLWFGCIAAGLWLVGRQRKDLLGIVLCVATLGIAGVLIVFLFASKTHLIFPIIWLAMAFYMAGRRPSLALIVVALCLVALVAFTFVPTYRSTYLQRYGHAVAASESFVSTGAESLRTLSSTPVGLSETLGLLVTRFGGIDNAARVVDWIPERFGFLYFREILLVPFSLIPRAIFPNKPSLNVGRLFTVEVAGMTSGGAAAPHPVAEGYFNLGWIGVPVLFWIWGLYQSLLYHGFYLPRKESPLVQTLYAYYALQAIGFGGWIISSLLGLPGNIVFLLPFVLILRDAPRRARARA